MKINRRSFLEMDYLSIGNIRGTWLSLQTNFSPSLLFLSSDEGTVCSLLFTGLYNSPSWHEIMAANYIPDIALPRIPLSRNFSRGT